MDKYEQLTVDLNEAQAAADALYKNSEDGGSANQDGITLSLPRWKTSKVEKAASAAGMSAWKHPWGFFVIYPRTSGMGNRNTRICEAVRDHMKAKGYAAGMFYKTD